MSSYKNVQCRGQLDGVVADAFSQLTELGEEMRSWCDNMEEKFSSTSRYQMASDAADALENLSEVDVSDLEEKLRIAEVEYSESQPSSKRKSPSRATRLSNAAGMLHAAAAYIEDWIVDLEGMQKELDHEAENYSEQFDDLDNRICECQDKLTELQDAASEAENVEFPGMFG